MSKRFVDQHQQFLYFNDSFNVPKQSVDKVNVVNVKPTEPTGFSKNAKAVPTARDVLNDFLESTSVHGLQYFGNVDIKVGVCGKILWTCTMITGFVCLGLMVIQFLRRYNDDPTNTYIKSFYNPIFEAPFPAVTICPFSPIPLQRRLEILDGVILSNNITRELAMNFLKYGHFLTMPYPINMYEDMDKLKEFLEANKWSVLDFLKILKPCEDIVESCSWSSEHIDCKESIVVSFSSYGLCCSFNYLLEKYVGREKGQPAPKPLVAVDFGRRSGLKLLIKEQVLIDEDDGANKFDKMITNSDGVMVIIHHSMDFPGLNSNAYIIQKSSELQISITPELIEKPEGLYHRNKKNKIVPVCIPDSKNSLDYFPSYRYLNCYANCRIKMMIQNCGCLPYIFSNIATYYRINHCGLDGLICVQKNSEKMSIVKDVETANISCKCRTPCKELSYKGFPNSMTLMQTNASSNYKHVTTNDAVLRVFMKSQVFQITETVPAADAIYLLASIGGIFSLFLGCSFLSVAEIFYFGGLLCRSIFLRRSTESPSKRKRIAFDSHTLLTE
ncbi:sodium channel protein Nach isoform X2 [Colletes latitarsis]|uniref:sodium channel protein Nach isoform X2 n=1 Tax=Colletes latitarsis TaxID=2605962 RepID=UPI004035C71F